MTRPAPVKWWKVISITAAFSMGVVATATCAAAACRGDCNQSGDITVDEVIRGVNMALGSVALDDCRAFDLDDNGAVTVDEILGAVNDALNGCGGTLPSPTASRTATASPTPTATQTLAILWTHRGPDIDYKFGLPTGFDALALDADRTLYAGIAESVFDLYGVYVTPDRGDTWQPSSTQTDIFALHVDQSTGTIYAIGANRKVLRSTDGGGVWTEIGDLPQRSSSISAITNLFVDPREPDRLYSFGTGNFGSGGANRSTDGGATWSALAPVFRPGLIDPDSDYTILAQAPSDSEILYATGYDGGARKTKVGISDDAGDTWTPIDAAGLGQNEVTALAIDPSAPQTLYAGTKTTVFKSTNGGFNWLPVPAGLPQQIEVLQIVADAATPNTFYLAKVCSGQVSRGGGCVFRSVDGGAHWEDITNGLDVSCPSNPPLRCYAGVNRILLDPQSQILYAGTKFGVYSASVQ